MSGSNNSQLGRNPHLLVGAGCGGRSSDFARDPDPSSARDPDPSSARERHPSFARDAGREGPWRNIFSRRHRAASILIPGLTFLRSAWLPAKPFQPDCRNRRRLRRQPSAQSMPVALAQGRARILHWPWQPQYDGFLFCPSQNRTLRANRLIFSLFRLQTRNLSRCRRFCCGSKWQRRTAQGDRGDSNPCRGSVPTLRLREQALHRNWPHPDHVSLSAQERREDG